MRNKVALLIPYFGTLPNYFSLWRKSAEANKKFDFLFFTDCFVKSSTNIKVVSMKFSDLKKRISELFPFKIKCKTPYKLCDYKPVYGLIFKDYIKEYDFWGFCDIDLILGDLSKSITDEILDNSDKIFFHGHFSLFRNSDKMNSLFKNKYPNVLDYKYAFRTNYSCHFDESGTAGFAHEVDKSIRYACPGTFLDVNAYEYRIMYRESECLALWKEGKLYLILPENEKKEVLYIHLQKRKMKLLCDSKGGIFGIFRNQFVDISESEIGQLLNTPVNSLEAAEFKKNIKRWRWRQIIDNICNGAVKARIYRRALQWKMH